MPGLRQQLEARPGNRRCKGATELTPEGERVIAEGRDVMEGVVRESFAPFEADECALLGGMLERLLAD